MKIGIMGAMPEETNMIKDLMIVHKEETIGGNQYFSGELGGVDVILTTSGCGKSLAASTATILLAKYGVKEIIFTGIAGAVDPELTLGDIVIGKNFIYHDMDTRPIFPKFRVPYTENSFFSSSQSIVSDAYAAATRFTNTITTHIPTSTLQAFAITKPQIKIGTIATGDKFVTDAAEAMQLMNEIKEIGGELCCVEMEGATVAHICEKFAVDCVVIRTISDNANHSAHIDYGKFLKTVTAPYSAGIIQELLKKYVNQ